MSELNAYVSASYNVKHSCDIFRGRTGQNVLDILNFIFLLFTKIFLCSKYFSHSLSNTQLYFEEPQSIHLNCNKILSIFISQRKDFEFSDQNSYLY